MNRCIDECDSPHVWLTSVVVAILKKNRSPADPDGHRAVVLECCLLNMLTLLIHRRLYSWAEGAGIIPPSQNGFREGYRTNNNAFILRCLIDRARAQGKTVFVAFVDISNTFPSTNQAALWMKMYDMGVCGKLFDWLRMLYRKMTYVIAHDGLLSEQFRALCGVLMGDPASPGLWNLFFSDFSLPLDPDDLSLFTTIISHLEHADDVLIASSSAAGLQAHLNSLARWCGKNFLVIDVVKSKVMVFGPLPSQLPVLTLNDNVIDYVESYTYVGVVFQSTHRNIFTGDYALKASRARAAANAIIGVEK